MIAIGMPIISKQMMKISQASHLLESEKLLKNHSKE